MVKRLREKGQALVEYVVLIPPVLLLSTSVSVMVPPTGYGMLCDLDQAFDGGMCDELVEEETGDTGEHENPPPAEPGSEPTPQPTLTPTTEPTLTPTPEPEACVDWAPEDGSSLCDQTDGCDVLPGDNQGYYMAEDIIEYFVIKAGQNYVVFESGITQDGCYNVHISSGSVSWDRVGSGSTCKDISHLQVWQVPWCE